MQEKHSMETQELYEALAEAEAGGRTGDMHRRSVIYAPGGIIGMHISLKITSGCQRGEPMRYSRSFTSPAAPSMVTVPVILSKAKNLEMKGGTTDHEQVKFVSY